MGLRKCATKPEGLGIISGNNTARIYKFCTEEL